MSKQYNYNQTPERAPISQRLMVFAVVFMAILLVQRYFFPQKPKDEKPDGEQKQEQVVDDVELPISPEGGEPDSNIVEGAVQPEFEPDWVTLGSIDSESPYRMLITLTNRGAAPLRLELNSDRYRDTEDHSGYMGQIVADTTDDRDDGCLVQVVGPGTPAAKAGIQPGDLIQQVDDTKINGFDSLRQFLLETNPGQKIQVTLVRGGEPKSVVVELTRRPMELIRPESIVKNYSDFVALQGLQRYNPGVEDPLSFLLTLNHMGDKKLDLPKTSSLSEDDQLDAKEEHARDESIGSELFGLKMRSDFWEIKSATEDEVVFRYPLPKYQLEVLKTYRLAKYRRCRRYQWIPSRFRNLNREYRRCAADCRICARWPERVADRGGMVRQKGRPPVGESMECATAFFRITTRNQPGSVVPKSVSAMSSPYATHRSVLLGSMPSISRQ